ADHAARQANSTELIRVLDEVFGSRTLAEWLPRLAELETPWTIAQTAREARVDPQVVANEYVIEVEARGTTPVPLVASPVRFDDTEPELRPAPEHGADTEAVLLELGRSWDDIAALKEAGVIP